MTTRTEMREMHLRRARGRASSLPARSLRHIDMTPACSRVRCREASILEWRVVNPRQFTPAKGFTNHLRISASRVAMRVPRNPQRVSSFL